MQLYILYIFFTYFFISRTIINFHSLCEYLAVYLYMMVFTSYILQTIWLLFNNASYTILYRYVYVCMYICYAMHISFGDVPHLL